jgi:glyoxylase-like metal-dependent hydrolase (beta-lactamase superfamily II)
MGLFLTFSRGAPAIAAEGALAHSAAAAFHTSAARAKRSSRSKGTQKEKDDPASVPWMTDSVLPIVVAKRAQIVTSDFALNESVQFIPTPGHTIDHYSVLVGHPGRDALITGDMIHSPIQGKYPELGMRADYDSRQAGKTRRQIFDRFCDAPTIMCAVEALDLVGTRKD